MVIKKTWLAALFLPVVLLATGCQEAYRYPCQDPENWEKKECKKPFCSANGTCPEDLQHYDKPGNAPAMPASVQQPKTGVCK